MRTKKRSIEKFIILTSCALVTICVAAVLLFFYEPSINTLGAMGTVCIEVISMAVILILVVSLTADQYVFTKTTKLFFGLMIATVAALFFDFINWAADGYLSFDNLTYAFTTASLCGGALMACLFVLYLSSYLSDMHGLKTVRKFGRICAILNGISFVITLILALTKQAFTYDEGHYVTGPAYDYVMVIPVLTLLFMTGFTVSKVKKIGIHDVMAVVGYIFTMICGAIIEALYGIGATYVSVAIADIFIFIMLQNRLIDRAKKQKEALVEKNLRQYEILESMAGIYSYVNFVDLENMTSERIDLMDSITENIDLSENPHSELNQVLANDIADDHKDAFWKFTDLNSLAARMTYEKIITAEFCSKKEGWIRASYIRIGESVNEPIKKVIYAVRNIDEEKKNVEKWIYKSNTDELTGFFNRHAYEDDVAALNKDGMKENFVYVSMDVNSLKMVNDSFGHEAGDEIIVGACECMKQCFGSYGKLYRTGGDEFAALIYADAQHLEDIKKDIAEVTGKWHGTLNDNLAISCGYVAYSEVPGMSLHEIAVLADKRMYEDKSAYYRRKGIDRRGQRDAYEALCVIYTKILKINITNDSYQIIYMDSSEQTKDKGFSTSLKQWLTDFASSGQVHPDDIEDYLSKTTFEYIIEHFVKNKTALCIPYRRKYGEQYKPVVMELVPANDYSDEFQSLFMYVKEVEE